MATAGFDDMQKFSREGVDIALKSFGSISKGFQAVAAEVADYSKKSFEDSSSLVEKLTGAKSLDKAIEIQADFVKSSYETYLSRMTKLGELYVDIAKESYKPVETAMAKVK